MKCVIKGGDEHVITLELKQEKGCSPCVYANGVCILGFESDGIHRYRVDSPTFPTSTIAATGAQGFKFVN